MAMDLSTVVILGAAGAALALKSVVDFAESVEKVFTALKRARQALLRAFIEAKIYSRRKRSRLLNFFWFLFTRHPIIGPEDEPTPPKPGGRKAKPGPIATVGYGIAPKLVSLPAAASPTCSASWSGSAFCTA
jgi:hypothetical protein